MYFFYGFLFTAGAFSFIVVVVVLIGTLAWLRNISKHSYVEVELWEEYLRLLEMAERYEEAKFILALIKDKSSHEKVRLPKGYSLKKKLLFVENDEVEDGFEIKWQKKIIRNT